MPVDIEIGFYFIVTPVSQRSSQMLRSFYKPPFSDSGNGGFEIFVF